MITETLRLVPTSESWELQRRSRVPADTKSKKLKPGDWTEWTPFAWYPKAEHALDRIAREIDEGSGLAGVMLSVKSAADHIREIRAQLENEQ